MNGGIEIHELNIGVLHLGSVGELGETAGSFAEEVARGVSEETLDDIGIKPPLDDARHASAVAITPQNPVDRREEISISGGRNEQLMKAEKEILGRNSKEAKKELIEDKKVKAKPGELGRLKKNSKIALDKSKKAFGLACEECVVVCPIRDNFPAWKRIHGNAKAVTVDRESSRKWQGRLLQAIKAGEDPELVPCLPPKKK